MPPLLVLNDRFTKQSTNSTYQIVIGPKLGHVLISFTKIIVQTSLQTRNIRGVEFEYLQVFAKIKRKQEGYFSFFSFVVLVPYPSANFDTIEHA